MQAYARRLQAHIVGKSGARWGSHWRPDLVNRMGSPLSITIAFGMRHYARIASTALSARPGLRAAREAAPAHAPAPQRTSPRRSGTPAGRPPRRPHRTSSSPAAPAGWGEGQAAVLSLRHSRRDAHPFPRALGEAGAADCAGTRQGSNYTRTAPLAVARRTQRRPTRQRTTVARRLRRQPCMQPWTCACIQACGRAAAARVPYPNPIPAHARAPWSG